MKHKTLYNTMANSPCGKCKKKNCELTVRQVKAKKCLGKNCWHLVKYPEHEWWHQRELAKERKKEKKKKREEALLKVGYKEAYAMKKLTKNNIEKLATDIMKYLMENDLDSDVCIYYNNMRLRHEYDWRNADLPPKVIIEDNMNPLDYFEYASYKHILSMSFEGPLYYELNYNFGKKSEKLRDLFEKYGLYWELGDAWNLTAYPLNDDMEVEFTDYGRPKETRNLYMWDDTIPTALREIMDKWYELSKEVGDKGCCVIGAGFDFTWNGIDYHMCSCSPWQGSISWETPKDEVKAMLENIGATNIIYKWGIMD